MPPRETCTNKWWMWHTQDNYNTEMDYKRNQSVMYYQEKHVQRNDKCEIIKKKHYVHILKRIISPAQRIAYKKYLERVYKKTNATGKLVKSSQQIIK